MTRRCSSRWRLAICSGLSRSVCCSPRLGGKGDIRDIGSGNIGATNVLRTGSKGLAALTLVLDCLKATAAILVAALPVGPIPTASPRPGAPCSATSIRCGSASRAARASPPCSASSSPFPARRRDLRRDLASPVPDDPNLVGCGHGRGGQRARRASSSSDRREYLPASARFRAAGAVEAPRQYPAPRAGTEPRLGRDQGLSDDLIDRIRLARTPGDRADHLPPAAAAFRQRRARRSTPCPTWRGAAAGRRRESPVPDEAEREIAAVERIGGALPGPRPGSLSAPAGASSRTRRPC